MTDKDAREYGAKILAKARGGGDLAAFVRHALTAIGDRAELVAALDYTTIQAVGYSRAGDAMMAARQHMEGH